MSLFPSSRQEGGWAVALSGGPDSLALAAMLATRNTNGLALIVDHGLRPESAQEAAMVAGRAEALGLQTKVLRWTGEKPTTGLMEAARHARYDLLIEACRQAKCSRLYLAHHQDDQIETALFRLARGSGWRGLAAMPDVAQRGGVALLRPLLQTPKAALTAYCEAHGLAYVTDPGNSNPRFQRARLRRSGGLSLLGFDSGSVANSLKGWRSRRQAELETLRALSPAVWNFNPLAGFAEVDEAGLAALAPALQRELLLNLAQTIGQARYRSADDLLQPRPGWTVMGCRFLRQRGKLLIGREVAGCARTELQPGQHQLYWDRRFDCSVTVSASALLAPLAEGSWRSCEGADWLEEIPGFARAALPGLWQEGRLVMVPKPVWRPLNQPLSQIFRNFDDFDQLSANG